MISVNIHNTPVPQGGHGTLPKRVPTKMLRFLPSTLLLAFLLITTPNTHLHADDALRPSVTTSSLRTEDNLINLRDVQGKIEDILEDEDYDCIRKVLWTIQRVSGTIFTALITLMLILSIIDHRHPRPKPPEVPISVVIPCYNDAVSVRETIESVFRSYPKDLLEVLVINDHSKDNSLEKIKESQKTYPISIIDNERNKGKARSLNDTIPTAKHDFVLCLDADTLLNKVALSDLIARLHNDSRIGAASSPYKPKNKGFLPILQAVEYSMLLLTQGAHNLTSAMALWGGCIMLRKTAFIDVGGFNLAAITEDVDFAFKLNRKKWRVEQSFRAVRSIVPQTLKSWIRQKLRWTSGGTQCYWRHIPVWIKNPIQIFFIFSYSFLLASTIPNLFDGLEITNSFNSTWNNTLPFYQNLLNVNAATFQDIWRRLVGIAICYIPSFIYIIPLVRCWKDAWKFILVIPFSIFYFPLYMIVSLFGMAIGVRSLIIPKRKDTIGWEN